MHHNGATARDLPRVVRRVTLRHGSLSAACRARDRADESRDAQPGRERPEHRGDDLITLLDVFDLEAGGHDVLGGGSRRSAPATTATIARTALAAHQAPQRESNGQGDEDAGEHERRGRTARELELDAVRGIGEAEIGVQATER